MRNHLYPLDALRFLAAFSVLSYHLGFFGWASHWGTTPTMLNHAAQYPALAPFTWFGWIGVEVFFVISGFVIAYSAHSRSATDFLKGRLLRLYPAAWICATITLLAWLVIGGKQISEVDGPYLRSISLWIVGPWIDGVYWSLAVEIVFYTIVLFVLVGGRFVSIAALPWWLTSLSVLHVVGTVAGAHMSLPPHLGATIAHVDELLARRACFFAMGIWLWLMSRGEMKRRRYLGLAIAVGSGLAEIEQHAREEANQVAFSMSLPVWLPLVIWTLAFAFVVVVALRPRWFEVRGPRTQATLTRIGLMTYPLFLVHDAVGAGVIRTAVTHGVNQWAALLLAVATVLGLAYFICAVPEVQIRKGLRALLNLAEGGARRVLARGAGASTR